MEWFSRRKIQKSKTLAALVATNLLMMGTVSAQAGTVFSAQESSTAQDPARGPVETFPTSSFGEPPMRGTGGVGIGFASREVTEMEASDEAVTAPAAWGNRSPAAMDFGGGTLKSRAHSAPPSRNLAPKTETVAEFSNELVSAASRKGVQEVALIASDLGFFPRTVFVSRDVPVRMFVTGASKNTLCIMMDSFQVRKQVRSQKIEEITFTPATPGKYRFYCPVNGMEGTLIVKELSTDPSSSGAPNSLARVTASDVLGD